MWGMPPCLSCIDISQDTRPSCLTSHQLYGSHTQRLMSVHISGPGWGHVWLLYLVSAPWRGGVMAAHQSSNLEAWVQVLARASNFSEKFDWSDVGDVGYVPLPLMYWYITGYETMLLDLSPIIWLSCPAVDVSPHIWSWVWTCTAIVPGVWTLV